MLSLLALIQSVKLQLHEQIDGTMITTKHIIANDGVTYSILQAF